jgi:hypothetical protein
MLQGYETSRHQYPRRTVNIIHSLPLGSLPLAGKAGTVRLDVTHLDPTGLLGWQVHFLKPSNSPTSSSSGGAGADSIQSSSSSSSGSSSSGEGALVLCVSPSKRYFRGIQTHINNAVTGVTQVRRTRHHRRCF